MAVFRKRQALTFDDVLLMPKESDVVPRQVSLGTRLTQRVGLNVPLISAAMDTVTGAQMAVVMAFCGGIGIIHKNMSINEQAEHVKIVKGTAIDLERYPQTALCKNGLPLVGAAVGVSADMIDRVSALVNAGCDVIVLDSAHGHSTNILSACGSIKKYNPNIELVAGNVATAQGTKALIDAGADAVKVGIGPGSICTTRIVAGVGVPQITATTECATAAAPYDIPIICDGGIKYSGDITKAIGAGASVCMLGSLLAGHSECPGEIITEKDGIKYMSYRGMGSEAAMKEGSADRYNQTGTTKFVPEGIEAKVPLKGSAENTLHRLLGGLRSGMGYCGAKTVEQLRTTSEFVIITPAGLNESHTHSVY